MKNNGRSQIKRELEYQSREKLKNLTDNEKDTMYKKQMMVTIICSIVMVVIFGVLGPFMLFYDTDYADSHYISLVGGLLITAISISFLILLILAVKTPKNKIVVRILKMELKPLIKETIKINEESFYATKIIKTPKSIGLKKIFIIDENTCQFVFKKGFKYSKIYQFNDFISCDVYEKNYKQLESTAGTAAVGGLLFGTTGAIVGSSVSRKIEDINTGLGVIISLNSEENTVIIIEYIRIGASYDMTSLSYMEKKLSAQQFCSEFSQIFKGENTYFTNQNKENKLLYKNSNKERLKELKEMLDDGLITQEDFEQKKKQILGL